VKRQAKGNRGLLIAALEAEQAVLDLAEIGEVVGGQDLAPVPSRRSIDA
jgi:hypothetical protein